MSLRSDCDGVVPASLLPLVPGRFDVIGDIAIVSLSDPLLPYASGIARAILTRRKSIRTIARKVTKMEGEDRVARFELLAGNSTETLHHEYGFAYRLDITEAFFAPRLASERKRVTDLVVPGETVLVPFAGVGPFVIPAAARGGIVTAIEQNPAAFRYLEENVAGNGVAVRTQLIMGDAFDPSHYPEQEYARAIIPAPYGKDGILDTILPAVQSGGMIHLYTFRKSHEIEGLVAEYQKKGASVQMFRKCGNVAPGVHRWVFDLRRDP